MTREKALEIMSIPPAFDTVGGEIWIQRFVALGMLKFDEPKSAQDKFNDAFRAMDADARKYLCNITTLIDVCGLKIVEK